MSATDISPPVARLNLPSPEEYRKRKVALISGANSPFLDPCLICSVSNRYNWPGWFVSVCTFHSFFRVFAHLVPKYGTTARERLSSTWHYSSFLQFQHWSSAPSLRRTAREYAPASFRVVYLSS